MKKKQMDCQDINLNDIKLVFIIVFVLGIFAYGYGFMNFTPAHDGMMTVTHDQNWQTSIGRGLMQVYVKLRGQMNAPWLIGILALIYTSIAAWLTICVLGISEELWKYLLISSLYVLNIAYICSVTVYIYLFDIFAMALLLAIMAVYSFLKCKNDVVAIFTAAMFLSLSMGLYQSYFAVTVCLFIIIFIIKIISEGDDIRHLLTFVLEELCVVVLGSVFYGITLKVIQLITNVSPVDNYNSISNIQKLSFEGLLFLLPAAYENFFDFFFKSQPYANKIFTVVNTILVIIGLLSYFSVFVKTKKLSNIALLSLVILSFPLGANCIYVLSGGMIHYLMEFSYQFFYILLLLPLLQGNLIKNGGVIMSRMVVVAVLTLSLIAIRFSNDILYYQKLVGEGTEASITNIIYDIEKYPGFDENTMSICLIGDPEKALSRNYEMLDVYGSYPGISPYGTTVTYSATFSGYLHYILGKNYNFNYSEENIVDIKATEEYRTMSVYPLEGYIKVIDGNLVVRFE